MPDVKRQQTFCRVCAVCCPIVIDVVDGQLLAVNGDRSNEISGGYTCVKGRAQTEFYRSARRLMHSMKRDGCKRGIVTLCIGGGQGIALALELLE